MHARPSQLADVDLAMLSPFLRALLTIDGTVTQFIEAYMMERVLIRVLAQSPEPAGESAQWLDCATDSVALRRRSMLVGADTDRLYAYAESLLLPGRLSADMRAGLEQEPGGLGKIILNSAIETRREALWFGQETPPALPESVARYAPPAFLTRSYRVMTAEQPIMQITERFPLHAATGG